MLKLRYKNKQYLLYQDIVSMVSIILLLYSVFSQTEYSIVITTGLVNMSVIFYEKVEIYCVTSFAYLLLVILTLVDGFNYEIISIVLSIIVVNFLSCLYQLKKENSQQG